MPRPSVMKRLRQEENSNSPSPRIATPQACKATWVKVWPGARPMAFRRASHTGMMTATENGRTPIGSVYTQEGSEPG